MLNTIWHYVIKIKNNKTSSKTMISNRPCRNNSKLKISILKANYKVLKTHRFYKIHRSNKQSHLMQNRYLQPRRAIELQRNNKISNKHNNRNMIHRIFNLIAQSFKITYLTTLDYCNFGLLFVVKNY